MLYRINEIFYSIQGEGYHTGKPCLFVRFAGCNLKCKWCDTDHKEVKEYAKEELVETILTMIDLLPTSFRYSPFIVLTGGEPTMQPLLPLLELLTKRSRLYIGIETNGTNPVLLSLLRKKNYLQWITVSPKPDVCYTKENMVSLIEADEIKVVYDNVIDLNDFKNYHYKKDRLYVQPCSENFTPAIDFVLKNPEWRLSVQVQKVIKIR